MAPNSLFGAMSIGGMALAMRLRQEWPDIELNETHPKVIVSALGGKPYRDSAAGQAIAWFAGHSGIDVAAIQAGHDLDAVLSAWVTREGKTRGWPDLVNGDRSMLFPAGSASYFWPEDLRSTPSAKPVEG